RREVVGDPREHDALQGPPRRGLGERAVEGVGGEGHARLAEGEVVRDLGGGGQRVDQGGGRPQPVGGGDRKDGLGGGGERAGEVGIETRRRSPRARPRAASAAAQRSMSATSSRYVEVVPKKSHATTSARRRAISATAS